MHVDPVLTYWIVWLVKLFCLMTVIKIGSACAVIIIEIRRAYQSKGQADDLIRILEAMETQQNSKSFVVKGSDVAN